MPSNTYTGFGIKQTVYQGSGCVAQIPEILRAEQWKRVLIVAGPNFIKTDGYRRITEMLDAAGVYYEVFSKIVPNPLQADVEEVGIPMYRNMNADVMLAIGGGSTMDSAKAIAMVGESGMNVKEASAKCAELTASVPVSWKTYPIIAVPTTCGSGSEVIHNAVISEPNGHKMVLQHDCILPCYAVCDPDLLATLPANVAAATVMDALVQAIESYVSLAATEFSETMSLRAVEHLGPHIVPFCHNRAIPEHADAISKGCMYAGFAWNNSFVAQVHGTNHPVTEILHISHGEACAVLLPPFVEFNGVVSRDKFWKVHNLMYPDQAVSRADFDIDDFVSKLIKLNNDINILEGKTMADFGCTEEIVDRILSEYIGSIYSFPRNTTKEQMKKIYMDVMNGKYTLPA